MINANNKSTRTTSMTSFCCFYCQLWTYFTPFSSVFIIDFEQVNVSWEHGKVDIIHRLTKYYSIGNLKQSEEIYLWQILFQHQHSYESRSLSKGLSSWIIQNLGNAKLFHFEQNQVQSQHILPVRGVSRILSNI